MKKFLSWLLLLSFIAGVAFASPPLSNVTFYVDTLANLPSQVPKGQAFALVTDHGYGLYYYNGTSWIATSSGATPAGSANDIQVNNGSGGLGAFSLAGSGNPPSPLFSNFGTGSVLTYVQWHFIGMVNEFFQAASVLFMITQGTDIDPRIDGLAGNAIYFGSSYGAGNPITTTQGSTHITAAGYNFQPGNACATASCQGDVGKRICISGNFGGDVGPCGCIVQVNNDGSAELSWAAWNSSTNNQGVTGGYATNPNDPLTCADDTAYYQNAASIQAIFHGGYVKAITRSMIHELKMPLGSWLKGNMGANYYVGTYSTSSLPFATPTMLTVIYCGATGFNTDSEACIDASSANGLRFSDFFLQGIVFPVVTLPGLTLTGIGTGPTGTANYTENTLVEHVSFSNLPVHIGSAFSYDWSTQVRGFITPGPGSQGTLTVLSAVTTTLQQQYPEITTSSTQDFPALHRVLSGTNVPANETIVSALGAGTTGQWIVSLSATTTTETLTLAAGGGMSGKYRWNGHGNGLIGMNGCFTDMEEEGGIYTGDFLQYGWYLSHGCGPNWKTGGRFEELPGAGVVIAAAGFTQFTGVEWQFNGGSNIEVMNCCNEGIQVTGGMMMAGGSGANGHHHMIHLAANANFGYINLTGVELSTNNNSAPIYLFGAVSGANAGSIGVDGGNVGAQGFGVVPFANLFDFPAGTNISCYHQKTAGWPEIDTCNGGTLTGFSIGSVTGGSRYETGLAGTTTGSGTLTISGMKPVMNNYYCDGGDITAGFKCSMSATTSSSCTLNCTTTVTSGDKLWIKSGEGN